jgi:hypothetical protein
MAGPAIPNTHASTAFLAPGARFGVNDGLTGQQPQLPACTKMGTHSPTGLTPAELLFDVDY